MASIVQPSISVTTKQVIVREASTQPYVGFEHQTSLPDGWQYDIKRWCSLFDLVLPTIPRYLDAPFQGVSESEYFQSGVGSIENRDLLVKTIAEVFSDHERYWAPIINHGYYYRFKTKHYLYGDNSRVQYVNALENKDNKNYLELDIKPDTVSPITAITYKRNPLTFTPEYYIKAEQQYSFSGIYVDGEEQQTVSPAGKITWANVDFTKKEFIVDHTHNDKTILWFNRDFTRAFGTGAVNPILVDGDMEATYEVGFIDRDMEASGVGPEWQPRSSSNLFKVDGTGGWPTPHSGSQALYVGYTDTPDQGVQQTATGIEQGDLFNIDCFVKEHTSHSPTFEIKQNGITRASVVLTNSYQQVTATGLDPVNGLDIQFQLSGGVSNASFVLDTITIEQASDWTAIGGASIEKNTDTVYEGTQSLNFTNEGATIGAGARQVIPIPSDSNVEYLISGRHYHTGATGNGIVGIFADGSMQWKASAFNGPEASQWNLFNFIYDPHQSGGHNLEFGFTTTGLNKEFILDNISATPVYSLIADGQMEDATAAEWLETGTASVSKGTWSPPAPWGKSGIDQRFLIVAGGGTIGDGAEQTLATPTSDTIYLKGWMANETASERGGIYQNDVLVWTTPATDGVNEYFNLVLSAANGLDIKFAHTNTSTGDIYVDEVVCYTKATNSYDLATQIEIGISNGKEYMVFRLPHFPVLADDSFYLYVADSASYEEWERVDSWWDLLHNPEPSPIGRYYLDKDLGIVYFGDHQGNSVPSVGKSIFVSYSTTLRVEYEEEELDKDVTALSANVNPVVNHVNQGFVCITHDELIPASITLDIDKQPIPFTYQPKEYGPIITGNDFGLLRATVRSQTGIPIPKVTTTFDMDPSTIGFLNGAATSQGITNGSGHSFSTYTPPVAADPLGEYSITVRDSIDYPGNKEIIVDDGLSLLNKEEEVYIYQVIKNDLFLGYEDLDTWIEENIEKPAWVINDPYASEIWKQEIIAEYDLAEWYWDESTKTMNGRKVVIYQIVNDFIYPYPGWGVDNEDPDAINPIDESPGAIIPLRPILIEEIEADYDESLVGKYRIVLPELAIPDPDPYDPENLVGGYWVVSSRLVKFRAQCFSTYYNNDIFSNEITARISLPSYLLGEYIAANLDKIPFGWKLLDDLDNVAAGLDGATFITINPTSGPYQILDLVNGTTPEGAPDGWAEAPFKSLGFKFNYDPSLDEE